MTGNDWAYIAVATTASHHLSSCLPGPDKPRGAAATHAGRSRAESRTTSEDPRDCHCGVNVGGDGVQRVRPSDGLVLGTAWVSVVGDVLVVAGLAIASLVVVQNAYAAATVRVEEGQRLATNGVYKRVRHPMYIER